MSIAQQNIFLGVNEVHTLQLPDDSQYCFVGMEVQGRVKPEPDNIVLIMSQQQIYEMADYFRKRDNEKKEIHQSIIKSLLEKSKELNLNIFTPSPNEWTIANEKGYFGFTYNEAFVADGNGKVIKTNQDVEDFFNFFL